MSLWTKVRNAVVTIARPIAAAYTGGASEIAYQAYDARKRQKEAAEAQARMSAQLFPSSGYDTPGMAYAGGTPGFYDMRQGMSVIGRTLPRLPPPSRVPSRRPPSGPSRPGVGIPDIGPIFGERVDVTGRRLRRRRRQNPLNVKALRRAIRRVKGFKKIEVQVNRLLPKRPAARGGGGSPGVITRIEAARALRR